MKHHKYLIVGGGMAADSAIHGIRKIDPSGAIAVICEELHLPYDRPLSPNHYGKTPNLNRFGAASITLMLLHI